VVAWYLSTPPGPGGLNNTSACAFPPIGLLTTHQVPRRVVFYHRFYFLLEIVDYSAHSDNTCQISDMRNKESKH
jgi:hypothetical protein